MLAPMSRPTHRPRGLTLVELLVAVVVLGVLAGLAVPSLNTFIMRKRVDIAANELMADLRLARSMTMQSNAMVRLTFNSSAAGTCYTVSTGGSQLGSCNCNNGMGSSCTAPSGAAPTEIKTVTLPAARGVSITPTSSVLAFNGLSSLPTVANFSADVTGTAGGQLRVSVSPVALSRICAVSGQTGYPACSP